MYGLKIKADVSLEMKLYRELIKRIETEMEQMPEGSLHSKCYRGNVHYYHYFNTEEGGKRQRYLSEKDKKLKALLVRKIFLIRSMKRLCRCIEAVEIFLESPFPYDPDEILSGLPFAFRGLGYKVDSNGNNADWGNAEYEKNELYLEGLVYGTVGGLMVRSKSEAIIAGLLEAAGIPFRYEAALKLGEKVYYPDFTIMRPRDNKILYWEHFGMMDDEEYALRAERKLAVYRKNDILPLNQLITTYETAKTSLNAQDIQNIINAFLM